MSYVWSQTDDGQYVMIKLIHVLIHTVSSIGVKRYTQGCSGGILVELSMVHRTS